jgi:hypothetical protein
MKRPIEALQEKLITGDFKKVPLLAYIGGLNTTAAQRKPLTDDVLQKIISKLEPLLSAKNQSWAEAEKMLNDIALTPPAAHQEPLVWTLKENATGLKEHITAVEYYSKRIKVQNLYAPAQPEQEPVDYEKNSPSDPEICNERSAQACGPVYCGDSGGYCKKCPKQKTGQSPKPCNGMNCGCTDGWSHSLECHAELAAAIAGGMFVSSVQPAALPAPVQEPVGRFWQHPLTKEWHQQVDPFNECVALYTASPQRPWVGLTPERIKEIWLQSKDHGDDWADVLLLARAFEDEIKRENT